MFRRMIAAAALLLALAAGALADSTLYTYGDLLASNVYYECEDFTADLPEELQTALADRIWANDKIICGAMRSAYLKSDPDQAPKRAALIAVERQGTLLLFGASDEEEEWNVCLETDSFFSPGQNFKITVLADYGMSGEMSDASLALIADGEEFRVVVRPNGCVELDTYRYERGEGSSFELSVYEGRFMARIHQDSVLVQESRADGLIPRRLCAWTQDSIPANIAQMKAFAQLNPAILGENEAVIYGVNFREEPTTNSHSMGRYTAKARLLEKPEDTRASWYHVAVGDTEGWASSTYVVTAGMQERRDQVCANLSEVLEVARTDREIALVSEPGGIGKQMIPAGTLMHIVARNNGWLHVIIPHEDMTWKTDWDGVYGFVQESSVTTGLSIADVKWK